MIYMQTSEAFRNLISCEELFIQDQDWLDKRNRAVKKIFNGNENEFKQFLSRIEPLQQWKDAMVVIEEEFAKRKVKSDTREATGLTDVLFKRYFPSY